MINVDTVYQRVLALANKEQRGYITPQEFNLMAAHAQMEILEQYLYDINQLERVPNNDREYTHLPRLIHEKLSFFKKTATSVTVTVGKVDLASAIPDLYKIGSIYTTNNVIFEEVKADELIALNRSTLARPSVTQPVYLFEDGDIRIVPGTVSASLSINYIRIPTRPRWGYVVVGEKALYDPTPAKTTNFELHAAEEVELVYKILKLAGIAIQRDDVAQSGGSLEQSQIIQEKQ